MKEVEHLKQRDLVRKLEAAGYRLVRKGDHKIFEKSGNPPIIVPDHKELNEYTAKAILKAAGLLK